MTTFINAFVFVITFGLVQQVIAVEHTIEPTQIQHHVKIKPHWSDEILDAAREAGRLPTQPVGTEDAS
jgi:hypothetical protein